MQTGHALHDHRVAVAHPHHGRHAPEEAVQQVDAPAQIEFELAVIPEHRAEQQLGHGAAHILVHAAHHRAEHKQVAVALVLILAQQHGGQGQSQAPHHAERPPYQTGTAHPDACRQAAEHCFHQVTQKRAHHEQPQQVGGAQGRFAVLSNGRFLPGRLRVGPLDALFHIQGNAAAQAVGAFTQPLVQLFQHRVFGRIVPHQHGRTDLVQRCHDDRRPHQRVQQPARDGLAQPQQQAIEPQHAGSAQHAPQQRILQADIAVQVEALTGVVPPFAAVQPFQQLSRQPLHDRGGQRTGKEEVHRVAAQVREAHGQQYRRGAVHKAEGPGCCAAVGKMLAPHRSYYRLPYPARKRVDQVKDAQRIKIVFHSSPFCQKRWFSSSCIVPFFSCRTQAWQRGCPQRVAPFRFRCTIRICARCRAGTAPAWGRSPTGLPACQRSAPAWPGLQNR